MAVVVQAGHVNIEQNCAEALRGETGAPGEREYVAGIAATVAGAIQAHGPVCIVADANFNCTQDVHTDYQAVVALHCDGRSTSGFAVGVGDPTKDGAAAASAKLCSALRSAYASATKLKDIDDLTSDVNVTEYYLFNELSQATPFALIELGAIAAADGSPGPDRDYLLSHQQQVAEGVVNGLLAFLGLSQAGSSVTVEPAPAEPSNAPAPIANPPQPSSTKGDLRAAATQIAAEAQTLLNLINELP